MNNTALSLTINKQELLKEWDKLLTQLRVEKDWQHCLIRIISERPMYDKRELLYDSNEQIAIYKQAIADLEERIEYIDKEVYAAKELEEVENNERGNW